MKGGHERPVTSPRLTKTDSLRAAERSQPTETDTIQTHTEPKPDRACCRFLRVNRSKPRAEGRRGGEGLRAGRSEK